MRVDLNELGLASYNELIRLELLENIKKQDLTNEKILQNNAIIYEKIGDCLLNQMVTYNKDKDPESIDFGVNQTGAYTQLILVLALCYINGMNLNNYFDLKVKL